MVVEFPTKWIGGRDFRGYTPLDIVHSTKSVDRIRLGCPAHCAAMAKLALFARMDRPRTNSRTPKVTKPGAIFAREMHRNKNWYARRINAKTKRKETNFEIQSVINSIFYRCRWLWSWKWTTLWNGTNADDYRFFKNRYFWAYVYLTLFLLNVHS